MSSVNYNKLPLLISDELIERASRLSSAQLCDGMAGMGILRDGAMDASMMPVAENMKVVGTACTVSTDDGDNFPIHVGIYQGQPGYVLMIDGKGHCDHAYMGDLMVSAAQAIGFNGIVLDGCVRDKVGLKELKLPVFSKGFMQRGPIKKSPGELNTVITCAGVAVNPGDLVFGDYDGVTVVPRDRIEAVLEKAEKKDTYEIERRKAIAEYATRRAEGKETPDIAPNWVNEMKEKLGI